jgi:hypothetical protein
LSKKKEKEAKVGKKKQIATPDWWECTRLKGGTIQRYGNGAEDNELNEEELESNLMRRKLLSSPIKISQNLDEFLQHVAMKSG